ncbi:NlpC/P60 family protein [Modestobacter sp. URMC 112]
MAKLTPAQIYAVALQGGFSPEQAVTFTAIALAESGGDPRANAAGPEDSRGLWQINVSPGVRPDRWGDALYDPVVNARAAYEISGGGTKLRPWSVTHGDDPRYARFLEEARAAAVAVDSGAASGTLPAAATAAATQGDAAGGSAVDSFVQAALDQVGDSYVFGSEVRDLDTPDPATFDCSELTEWAAHQAGVEIGDGSYNQYLKLAGQGAETDVEQALHTRGALLFSFSEKPTPGGGRPSRAHVAISLGDGTVVEAANPRDGVKIAPAGDRFNYAATIPGLETATPRGEVGAFEMPVVQPLSEPVDPDADGLTTEFELLLGTDPDDRDSDDDDLDDLYETTRSHTDPLRDDTDQDGTADAVEVAEGTDAGTHRLSDEVVAAGFGGAATADVDDDGLSDLIESQLGSDRDEADTDVDGVSDDWEYALGSDLRSIDTDRDGVVDGAEMDLGTLGPATPSVLSPATGADGLPGGSGTGSSVDALAGLDPDGPSAPD